MRGYPPTCTSGNNFTVFPRRFSKPSESNKGLGLMSIGRMATSSTPNNTDSSMTGRNDRLKGGTGEGGEGRLGGQVSNK